MAWRGARGAVSAHYRSLWEAGRFCTVDIRPNMWASFFLSHESRESTGTEPIVNCSTAARVRATGKQRQLQHPIYPSACGWPYRPRPGAGWIGGQNKCAVIGELTGGQNALVVLPFTRMFAVPLPPPLLLVGPACRRPGRAYYRAALPALSAGVGRFEAWQSKSRSRERKTSFGRRREAELSCLSAAGRVCRCPASRRRC